MRSIWFGDKRDVVKWSVLLHLAQQHKLSVIAQICFLNEYRFPAVIVDKAPLPVPEEVLEHFRSIKSVTRLTDKVTIEVFDELLGNRLQYVDEAIAFIDHLRETPRLVFLDPDTGIAPPSGEFNVTHVTEAELGRFWAALSPGDFLVLYQHKTNYRNKPWKEPKREQYASALGIDLSLVGIAHGEQIADDVIFFIARKA